MPDLAVSAPQRVTDVLIGADPGRPALVADGREITHGELRDLVSARAAELGLPHRSLVVLEGDTSLELVVTYLALLHAGHVPLLAARHADRLTDAWQPAAVVTVGAEGVRVERRADAAEHELHPDLALLMSTSGSTGEPKLVRLSRANLLGNATAIAEYLRLTPEDRGITSLPLHYCYGLSVLHSHLVAGASVVLTRASIVDPCFRAALVEHGVTNVAGVPHTFELAERADPERLAVPTLRFLTVAGGRMAPIDVRRWADRAANWGADLFVMYGQTEATARMAYLPPALVHGHAGSIGIAIPGGELRVDAPDGEVGELVYRGPNVMLGYATEPADLALGATLDELRTGDLARRDPVTGLFEITGRRSRFVKPFGLRIDLDTLQASLAAELGLAEVVVAGDDERLAVAAPGANAARVVRWMTTRTGLPAALVTVASGPAPRTPSGKPDHAALLAAATITGGPDGPDGPGRPTVSEASPTGGVARVFGTVLGRRAGPDDTFVSIGGDSLAYVECSIRLERVLGRLPADWHLLTVRELERHRAGAGDAGTAVAARPWWRRTARLDSTVLLRAIAICTIVATHMRVTYYPGGAHLLLALVGYNLSRFMLPIDDGRERVRAGLRTVWRTAGPVVAWVGAGMVLFGAYSAGTLLLVNNYVGPSHHRGDHWHFWFIEVFAHLVLLVTALYAIPAVRRLDRRHPYGFVLGVLAITLVFRYGLVEILDPDQLRFRTHGAAFFFVLGWLVHRSTTRPQRALTSAIVAVTVTGFFHWPQREQFIIVCLVALTWWREITVPRVLVAPVALVSTASLWILITHFTVWPPLADRLGSAAAYPIVVAAGVAAWGVVRAGTAGARAARAAVSDGRARAESGATVSGATASGATVSGAAAQPGHWSSATKAFTRSTIALRS